MEHPELDPRVVHMLDQSAAEFNGRKDEFYAKYGFEHTCTCDTDYTEGRVGEVTLCFAGLLNDALEACERLNAENGTLQQQLDEAVALVTEALPIVKEHQAKKELDDAAEGEPNEGEVTD